MAYRPPTQEERFWAKVRTNDPSGCWIWTGATSDTGYGSFNMGGGKYVGAHRYAYDKLVGAIPRGLTLDHLCRIRCCVNPDHLEAVTAAENIRRGAAPTAITVRSNRCARGHTMADAYSNSTAGARTCRTCHRERNRRGRLGARGQDFSTPTRKEVRGRSGGRCEINLDHRACHFHHRQLRRHGDHSAANCLHICDACHRQVHAYVAVSYEQGWLVKSTDDAAGITVTLAVGRVLLTADARYEQVAA